MAASNQHQQLAEQPAAPQQPPPSQGLSPLISIDIYLSLAVSIGAAGVSALAIKNTVKLAKQFQQGRINSMLPARETQRVRDLLAQAAVIAKSDRVTLGVFHNGHLSSRGYHMEHLAIAYAYERPGMASLPELHRDVPISEIQRELRGIWQSPRQQVMLKADDIGPDSAECALYLERRALKAIRLHLLTSGSTEVAILGFHYQDDPPDWNDANDPTIRRIELELTEIIRRASLQRPIWGAPIKK